jgi:hypothetical protein
VDVVWCDHKNMDSPTGLGSNSGNQVSANGGINYTHTKKEQLKNTQIGLEPCGMMHVRMNLYLYICFWQIESNFSSNLTTDWMREF